MRKITRPLLVLALLASARCAPGAADAPLATEWRDVLATKKAWQHADPAHRIEAHQAYVDALTAFVRRHPDHSRARAVYEQAELDFARLLAERGEYDRAVLYYRSVVRTNPYRTDARAELDVAERRRFVTAETLGGLQSGMTEAEVREALGAPLPGWSRSMRRGDAVIDSWYYRRGGGGTAAVFFRNGRLIAAECGDPVRLAPAESS